MYNSIEEAIIDFRNEAKENRDCGELDYAEEQTMVADWLTELSNIKQGCMECKVKERKDGADLMLGQVANQIELKKKENPSDELNDLLEFVNDLMKCDFAYRYEEVIEA